MSSAFDDVLTSSETTEEEQAQIQEDITDGFDTGSSSRGKLIPFSYLGGKYKHLNWLLPLLPHNKSYVEPYGGSGVVLLNREQSDVETFNDKYSEITNFFRVLREKPTELMQKISLTPYSEEEFELAQKRADDISNVEQARRFFVLVNMSYDKNINTPNWSYSVNYSSRGVSKKISSYQAKLKRIKPMAERLSEVQICNKDALDVIDRFDSDTATMYCDPPYPSSERVFDDVYGVEMDNDDQKEMLQKLQKCDADIAVSSYENMLYDNVLLEDGWEKVFAEEKKLSASAVNSTSRTEVLYVNYEVTDEMMEEAY